MSLRVAFQGEIGAYSHLVAEAELGPGVVTVPCPSFEEVFEQVEVGAADRGVLPIENSLAGTIHRVYDLLLPHALSIVGECSRRIAHCLIAAPGVRLEQIRVVRSHPQALAQCEQRLRRMGLATEPSYDTAGAVKQLAASGERDVAALASPLAARVNNMEILQQDMQDHEHNTTRFLIVSKTPLESYPSGELKASVAFSLKNVPGALFKALAVFALRDLDLTKLESRPIPGRTWEYMFYLDFVTNDFERVGTRAVSHLQEICGMFKVLGAYPRNDQVG